MTYCSKPVSHDMQRHERHHTGDKPFRCENCGKKFIDRGSLKKHSRNANQCFGKTGLEDDGNDNLLLSGFQLQMESDDDNKMDNFVKKEFNL